MCLRNMLFVTPLQVMHMQQQNTEEQYGCRDVIHVASLYNQTTCCYIMTMHSEIRICILDD